MKRLGIILIGIISILTFVVSCASDNPEMIEKIEVAEEVWESQNMSNYDLFIQRQRGLESAQFLTMSVVDGQIEEVKQECGAPPGKPACTIQEVDPEKYTVPELFQIARDTNHRASVLSFDDKTGVLTFLSLDDESIMRVTFTAQE